MENKSYSATITILKSPEAVFNCIKEVPEWWSNDFTGSSSSLDDEFVIHHTHAHYSNQKLVEVIPAQKITWLVTHSKLDWLKKVQNEWTNTKMIFEIIAGEDKTILRFTHEGLTPEKECYERCKQGWDMVITERLYDFISTGKAI